MMQFKIIPATSPPALSKREGAKCRIHRIGFALVACSVLLISSCRVSKELHKKDIKETEKTSIKLDSVDTSKTKTITVGENTILYGDTLNGSLAFTDDQVNQMEGLTDCPADSLESGGIKVKVSLVKVKGGVKAKIQAIAKPTSVTNKFAETKTEQKGVAVKQAATVEKKSETDTKDLKIESFPVGIIIAICVFLVIGLVIWWFLKKEKNFI